MESSACYEISMRKIDEKSYEIEKREGKQNEDKNVSFFLCISLHKGKFVVSLKQKSYKIQMLFRMKKLEMKEFCKF